MFFAIGLHQLSRVQLKTVLLQVVKSLNLKQSYPSLGLPDGSVAKKLPANIEMRVPLLGRKGNGDSTSVFLPGK